MITKNTNILRKLPTVLYKTVAQFYIDKNFPRHIFIETSANCNLNCTFCPRQKINEDMDFELFKSIVNECSQYGARSFSLHLFGEPLLYPRIMDAINYIKTKNKRHTILLTTNGTVLNKFARRLLESGVDRIIWSWRRLSIPFSADTIKVLEKIGMVRLLIEETPKEEFEKWKTFPRVEIKHLHNYGGHIDTTRWGLTTVDKSARFPCYHLFLAPSIRWNGDITICCNDPYGKEVISNYKDASLAAVWKSEKMIQIREEHMRGEYKGLCKNCNVWKTYPSMFFDFQLKQGHPK